MVSLAQAMRFPTSGLERSSRPLINHNIKNPYYSDAVQSFGEKRRERERADVLHRRRSPQPCPQNPATTSDLRRLGRAENTWTDGCWRRERNRDPTFSSCTHRQNASTARSIMPLGAFSEATGRRGPRNLWRPCRGACCRDDGRCVRISDTKWKRLYPSQSDWGVTQEDIYQMASQPADMITGMCLGSIRSPTTLARD